MDSKHKELSLATTSGAKRILAWVDGVPVEDSAIEQLDKVATLPFVSPHVAVMPDVHTGIGSTIGSVIPTHRAIIPAAVGVDIGCGMLALRTSLDASDLPDNLYKLRCEIEAAVPHGRTHNGDPSRDKGAWYEAPLGAVLAYQAPQPNRDSLYLGFEKICDKYPHFETGISPLNHLGTLGTGNHFIEICLDESNKVWIMLHSGSRGIGNKIGRFFIERAKEEMEKYFITLPDKNLSYLPEGTPLFNDYVMAVNWAQEYALLNRELMLNMVLIVLRKNLPPFDATELAINCHHNYVRKENHFSKNMWVTRKGAVSAREGELGIIPGSMGAKSFIVRGKGNPLSFHSCSHGAGRAMSRTAARKIFNTKEHIIATEGVECRKDIDVIDETPMAYKDIDAVMLAQSDLVEIVHTLKQVVCVKG